MRRNYTKNSSDVVLFFGAGISTAIPLCLPTTIEFLDKFKRRIAKGREKDFLSLLLSLSDVKDIESALRKLHIFAVIFQDLRTVKANDSLLKTIKGDFQLDEIPKLCHALREKIYDAIFDEYRLELSDEEKEHMAERIYNPLFRTILKLTQVLECAVFTTNYDLAVEYFHQSKWGQDTFASPIVDGFNRSRSGIQPIWTGNFENTQSSRITLKLFKLHGSLNWRKSEARNQIEHTGFVQRRPDPGKEQQERVLIYPASEKGFILVEPFRTLHQYFDIYLRSPKVCIFMGFSFRDEYINSIIINALKNSQVKLLVVSPNASRNIEQNLPGVRCTREADFSKTESAVICINQAFGGDLALRAISEHLEKLL